MSEVVATSDAIRAYGAAQAGMAAGVAAAGAFDQTATMAVAAPVFGLIGQEFLFSFAVAQGNHASSVMELAGVYAASAMTAVQSDAAFTATETGSADNFTAATHTLS